MCTLASLKEVLFHARRYIEIDETQTIEVDDEDGVEESGSAVVVEEPIPLKVRPMTSPSADRGGWKRGAGGSGGKKWRGGNMDWRKKKGAGNEPGWKSGGGSAKSGWKTSNDTNWDDWNDDDWKGWKGNDQSGKKGEWKDANRDWNEPSSADKGVGGNSKTGWQKSWSDSKAAWGDGKGDKDWSWEGKDSQNWWKDGMGQWGRYWESEEGKEGGGSPERRPRNDWSDSESKCRWKWADDRWEKNSPVGDGNDELMVSGAPSPSTKPLETAEGGEGRSPSVVEEVEGVAVGSEGEAMSIVDDDEGTAPLEAAAPGPVMEPGQLEQVMPSWRGRRSSVVTGNPAVSPPVVAAGGHPVALRCNQPE